VIKSPDGDLLPLEHDIKVLPSRPIVVYPIVETGSRMLEKLPGGRTRFEMAREAVKDLEDQAQRLGSYSALMTFGAPCQNPPGIHQIVGIGAHAASGSLADQLPAPDPASADAPQLAAWLAAVDDYQRFKQANGIKDLDFMPVVIAARWDNCFPNVNQQGLWKAFVDALAPAPQAEVLSQPTTIPFGVITAHLPPSTDWGESHQPDLPLFLFFAEDEATFGEIVDAIDLMRRNDSEQNRRGCATLVNRLRIQEYGRLAEALEAKPRCGGRG
jgi:hypothetical protein